jgi:hypothetical protein
MKTFAACLALVLAPVALAQPADDSKANAVAERDRLLNVFIVTHAVDAAKTMYDDQFVLTTSSGKLKDKNAILADVGNPALNLTANETTDVVVRIRDNTALLTGILHQAGTIQGKSFDVRLHVTDTWVFTGGNWRLLAGHASTL